MKHCECVAICTDPERKEMWEHIFPPSGQVPLKSPRLEGWVELEGQLIPYYLVDLNRVSLEQKALLVQEMAAKFGIPESEAAANIESSGVSIRGKNLIITLCEKHRAIKERW